MTARSRLSCACATRGFRLLDAGLGRRGAGPGDLHLLRRGARRWPARRWAWVAADLACSARCSATATALPAAATSATAASAAARAASAWRPPRRTAAAPLSSLATSGFSRSTSRSALVAAARRSRSRASAAGSLRLRRLELAIGDGDRRLRLVERALGGAHVAGRRDGGNRHVRSGGQGVGPGVGELRFAPWPAPPGSRLGSTSTRTVPASTYWLSVTPTLITVPPTRAAIWVMRPSIWASSVDSFPAPAHTTVPAMTAIDHHGEHDPAGHAARGLRCREPSTSSFRCTRSPPVRRCRRRAPAPPWPGCAGRGRRGGNRRRRPALPALRSPRGCRPRRR